jgi:2-polyprenyl-3-methyl-5-hydroxy-6-metoxy-1,4-benzoquinol methylase
LNINSKERDVFMNKGLLACYICGSKDIFKYPTFVNGFELHSCKSCETGFTHPLPSDQYLRDYYDRSEWFEGGEFGGYENYEKQSRSSDELVKRILSEFDSKEGLSVLDVGCGYGSHLAIASAKGWKCFGVEKYKHARAQAMTKLKNSAFISENILDLPNRPFDLVLILDTIEHLTNPREMFYELFSIGAISENTVVAITTPNAGPSIASLKLDAWKYCHPPSHLFYFSKISFEFLLTELRFGSVTVEGMHPQLDEQGVVQSEGLFVSARGSDFEEFMHERYVPGTWSFLAKYEHIPRYSFANRYIKGSRVLDFGCGTGYGSLSLAKFADHVTGLDIDVSAIKYANSKHVLPNLDYVVSSSLGAELVNNSFDVITCFEMIEHVDQPTQVAAVKSFKKLLAVDGTLIISTPNPVVTSKYGPNLYHLREMSKGEFLELLRPEFKYVQII